MHFASVVLVDIIRLFHVSCCHNSMSLRYALCVPFAVHGPSPIVQTILIPLVRQDVACDVIDQFLMGDVLGTNTQRSVVRKERHAVIFSCLLSDPWYPQKDYVTCIWELRWGNM